MYSYSIELFIIIFLLDNSLIIYVKVTVQLTSNQGWGNINSNSNSKDYICYSNSNSICMKLIY